MKGNCRNWVSPNPYILNKIKDFPYEILEFLYKQILSLKGYYNGMSYKINFEEILIKHYFFFFFFFISLNFFFFFFLNIGMEFKEYFPCFNLGKILQKIKNEIETKPSIRKKPKSPKSPRRIFVKNINKFSLK